MDWILQSLQSNAALFLANGLLFSLLPLLSPCDPEQPALRQGIFPDLVYWFLFPFIYHGIVTATINLIFNYAPLSLAEALTRRVLGETAVGSLPMAVQIVLVLLLGDVVQYWLHRVFHSGAFWKFHAVHHAPEHVDWLTAVRFHPVNFLCYASLTQLLMYFAGFDPSVHVKLAPFNALFSGFVHANLNWTLGPFRYVIASPVFHRWHHTAEAEGMNKNYAPTFPFLDLLFGTFYFPKDRLPMRLGGVVPVVPETLSGQLAYPFTLPASSEVKATK